MSYFIYAVLAHVVGGLLKKAIVKWLGMSE